MNSIRFGSELANFFGILLLAAAVAAPTGISWAIEAHNDDASDKTTTELAALTTTNVKTAYYVATNTTGKEIKVDITHLLGTDITDVADANGHPTQDGLLVDDILLGQTGVEQANETDPSKTSYLEFVFNDNVTVGRLAETSASRVEWTVRVLAGGQYTLNKVNGTTEDYHTATSPDFGFRVQFGKGDEKLVDRMGMTKAEGSSVAGNYSQVAEIKDISLIRAENDGHDYLDTYDNPVVLRLYGYKAGDAGNIGDTVLFSVGFYMPDAKGVKSLYEGYATWSFWGGLGLITLGLIASPFVSLNGITPLSRRRPGGA